MKKLLPLFLALLCLALLSSAQADSGKTVAFSNDTGRVSFPEDAEAIDMGKVYLRNTDEDYRNFQAFLGQFPNLKQVDMFATEIRRNRIEELAARFPQIEFGWTMIISCVNELHPDRTPHRVRTDATAFSTLHNNTCTEHTAQDLSILKYCKNLQALDIGHNRVTDLSFLYDLPHLKVLIVACNLDLRDITPIGSLAELEYLELFKNDIHDISCLANCKNLVDLNLCFNRISDLTPLMGLTHLRRLWLFNSNNYSDEYPVSAEAVRALRRALPDCKVDDVSYSTMGGWREHPRYDTIYEMFWGTEYIPFTTLE